MFFFCKPCISLDFLILYYTNLYNCNDCYELLVIFVKVKYLYIIDLKQVIPFLSKKLFPSNFMGNLKTSKGVSCFESTTPIRSCRHFSVDIEHVYIIPLLPSYTLKARFSNLNRELKYKKVNSGA